MCVSYNLLDGGFVENIQGMKGRCQDEGGCMMLPGKVVAKLNGYGYIKVESVEDDFFFHKGVLKNDYFGAIRKGQEVYLKPNYDDPKGYSAIEVYTNKEGAF